MSEGLTTQFEDDPPRALRVELGRGIDDFHARSVPADARRFAFVLRTAQGGLAGGVCAVMAWQWLFVEALFIDAPWRKRGLGRDLLARAEAHAAAAGCRSVWLDTFQARDFYLRLGYRAFAELEDYPPGQSRWFLRKALGDG